MKSNTAMQLETNSWVDWLRSLSYGERQVLQERLLTDLVEGRVSEEEAQEALYTWEFWARDEQFEPPGDWTYWLIQAGRGYGKTRIGSEWVRKRALSGQFRRINLIGATADDARDIQIEGELSGILAICPPHERPEYRPSKRRLEWPNGCWSLIFTADEPERLRGKQHESLWADELAAWKYPEAWDQAMLGLRIGVDPRCIITTTPKPVRVIRDLRSDPKCVVTVGSTYENRENLAPVFYETIIRKYEGTRMGRQELLAELLEDIEGALWTRGLIEKLRIRDAPELQRIVVGVDPSGSSSESANAAGIVAAGIEPKGVHGIQHGYVLSDRTTHGSPLKWAHAAIELYHSLRADRIVAEKNYGGEMVEVTLHSVDPTVPVSLVTASRGKKIRAEPVAALYEQERVHHVGGFADLEDEQCTWTPDSPESPNRMDALVWALTDLMLDKHDLHETRYMPDYEPEVVRRGDLVFKGRNAARHIDRVVS